MEKIAIITEYNPFHKGHKYQIEEIKKIHPEAALIAVMSGNIVQRGEFSIVDKFERTKIALRQGIDVVVELPIYYSLNGANEFAAGALKIINYLKIPTICFGSESNDLLFLEQAAEILIENQKKLTKLVKKNNSYPKSIEEIIGEKLKPNDILGLCYIKEIKLSNYKTEFFPIKRDNENFHKASEIRKMVSENKKCSDNLMNIDNPIFMNDFSDLIIGKLVSTKTHNSSIKYLQKVIKNQQINNFDKLIAEAANNSFTKAKLKRDILQWILEIKKTSYSTPRVLGVTEKGKLILKEWKKAGIKINPKFTKKYQNEMKLASFLELKHRGIRKKELSSLIIEEKDKS